ncbi:MAG: F0F1 ATP synthase subunit gamma [Gammaproteobacteria bacterium]|nr:F0F1 ATP synthase subunit gamma [Gammaproteobacteria bacterium]
MTHRRELEQHRRSLGEIRDIMNAMKNLSYMETRKISGFLDVQHAVVKQIETVASDFLSFYPDTLAGTINTATDVYLLIGSERGFCGDFNHALLQQYKSLTTSTDTGKLQLIGVGHKLSSLLDTNEHNITLIDGANVAEEISKVINQVVNRLLETQDQHDSLNLYVIYHGDEQQVINRQLLPPFHEQSHQQHKTYAPELNIQPKNFLLDLGYHYLFAVLHEILYTSLMAESRQRLAHLEGVVKHLDEQSEELHRQGNILRQEEIIEEIEVILLNSTNINQTTTQYSIFKELL